MSPSTRSSTPETADAVTRWAADRACIDAALADVGARHATAVAGAVGDSIRYALSGGGKRIRGLLLMAAFRTTGGEGDASPLAAAVEVVHAYSLVHDDLPCMDDDDMRRGRPTVHRVYGVAPATAAGVVMVPIAAAAALHATRVLGLDDEAARRIIAELMHSAGASGMIGGQLLDLEGEGQTLGVSDLERIHRAKTGALIRASVVLGGLAARAEPHRIDALATFGDAIGLAFQIADDVLDITATTDRLGKTAGRDLDLKKGTYPAALGIDGATERATRLVDDGCAALRAAGLLSTELDALARFVIERSS